jgi:lipoprotein
MKATAYILAAAALPILFSCSQHDIPLYSGQDAIFFDQQYPTETGTFSFDTLQLCHQIYTLVPFGVVANKDSTVMVKVETTGFVRDYDRPFSIELVADSTTAIQGEEYELPQTDFVIRAGQNSCRIPVIYHSSERMLDETVQVQIRLIPNEHFTLPFGSAGIGKMPLRYEGTLTELSTNWDPSIHNIFANRKLRKPAGWNNLRFGYHYSDKKYALILEISERELGWTVLDFENNTNNKMSISRAPVVAKHVSKYLMEQYRKGREHWVLDDDGTMMYVQGVTWTEGTDPNNMIDPTN